MCELMWVGYERGLYGQFIQYVLKGNYECEFPETCNAFLPKEMTRAAAISVTFFKAEPYDTMFYLKVGLVPLRRETCTFRTFSRLRHATICCLI